MYTRVECGDGKLRVAGGVHGSVPQLRIAVAEPDGPSGTAHTGLAAHTVASGVTGKGDLSFSVETIYSVYHHLNYW